MCGVRPFVRNRQGSGAIPATCLAYELIRMIGPLCETLAGGAVHCHALLDHHTQCSAFARRGNYQAVLLRRLAWAYQHSKGCDGLLCCIE